MGDDQLGHARVFPVLFDHKLRYHAHGATAGGLNAVDGRAHESGASGTVDEGVSARCQACAQIAGGLQIHVGHLPRRSGVDCDVHEEKERKTDQFNPKA